MPTFVVYEVWTRARTIKAEDENDAYSRAAPIPVSGLTLRNWHVVPMPQSTRAKPKLVAEKAR